MVILPAVAPSMTRPTRTHQTFGANAVIIQPIAEPMTLARRIFLRQNLSDKRPRYGAETKLKNAYVAPITPTIMCEIPNRSINDGRIGKIMVSPTRSRAIVRKIARFGAVR